MQSDTEHKYCPNYSAVLSAVTDDNVRVILRTRCKLWLCPFCARRNKREWRWRIMSTIEQRDENENWYLWTLTLSPKTHSSGDTATSLDVWRASWNKLMGKLRYRFGKFMYIRVFETHKSGILHVHMLANVTFGDIRKITQVNEDQTKNIRHHSDELETIMRSYGLGKIHDIKPIETTNYDNNGHARNVSAYVTKYLTKDIQSDVRDAIKSLSGGRVRMIQTSHGWQALTRQSDLKWEQGRITLASWLQDDKPLYDLQLQKEVKDAIDFGEDGKYEVYPPLSELD